MEMRAEISVFGNNLKFCIVVGPDLCDELELLVNEKLLHDVVFCVEDKYVDNLIENLY